MAALEHSHTKFKGKFWPAIQHLIAVSDYLCEQSNDNNGKTKQPTCISHLKKEEMDAYGYCPIWEDFYLVVCDVCGSSVKPNALKRHLELRHGGFASQSEWLTVSTMASTCMSTSTTASHSAVKCSTSDIFSTQYSTTSTTALSIGKLKQSDSQSCRGSALLMGSNQCSSSSSRGVGVTRGRGKPLSASTGIGHPQLASQNAPSSSPLLTCSGAATALSILQGGAPISSASSAGFSACTPQYSSSSYSLLEAALSHSPNSHQSSGYDQSFSNLGNKSSGLNSSMPYSSSSVPSVATSLSNMLSSNCSLRNALGRGSNNNNSQVNSNTNNNSALSNNLVLGISNGLDYNDSLGTGSNSAFAGLLEKPSSMTLPSLSPGIDFPNSPCSLSKDDEDSLDSRLRALHSPHTSHHHTMHQNNSSNDFNDALGGAGSVLNPSPHYSYQPPSVGSASVGPHSVGPPSVGPPSVGPPSVGPPSVGPSAVNAGACDRTPNHSSTASNVICNSNIAGYSNPNMNMLSNVSNSMGNGGSASINTSYQTSMSPSCFGLTGDNLLSRNGSAGTSSVCGSSSEVDASMPHRLNASKRAEEEEVNRISAMLQKEVEALTASQNLNSHLMDSHSSSDNLTAREMMDSPSLRVHSNHNPSDISSSLSRISSRTSTNISNSITNSMASQQLANNNRQSSSITLNSNSNLCATRQQLPDYHSTYPSVSNHNNNATLNSLVSNINSNCLTSQEAETVVSVEAYNQLRADLLSTVSESDLNAVLNATPDSTESPVLNNSSSQVILSDSGTVQFSGSPLLNCDAGYPSSSSLGASSGLSTPQPQQQYRSPQLSLSQLDVSNTLGNQVQSMAPNANTLQFEHETNSANLLNQAVDGISLSEFEKIMAQTDELVSVGNSNASVVTTMPTSLTGYNAHQQSGSGVRGQVHHVTAVQQPLTSPHAVATIPLGSHAPAASSVQEISALGQSVVTSQGITVVIGGTATPLTISQPIAAVSAVQPIRKASDVGIHQQVRALPQQSTNIVVTQQPTLQTQQIPSIGNQSTLHHALLAQNIVSTPNSATNASSVATSIATAASTVSPSVPQTTPSPKKSSKKRRPNEPRKVVPLKDREYNPDKHCGVLVADTSKPCTRSLTCKTHSLTQRRAVNCRSKKFDELLLEHKANKLPKNETPSTPAQGPSPRGSAVVALGASSPLLLSRTPSSGVVPPATPSPLSGLLHTVDTPSASPYLGVARAPTLSHSEHYYVSSAPQPLSMCSYNTRRMGGYFATDYKIDLLRSAVRTAIAKPVCSSSHSTTSYLLDSSFSSVSGSALSTGAASSFASDRLSNVKPLLARKLQGAVPLAAANTLQKNEGIFVGTGYNGHIQVTPSNLGIVATATGGVATQQFKRGAHHLQENVLPGNKSPSTAAGSTLTFSNKTNLAAVNKNKKPKLATENGPATNLNLFSNVVQIDTSAKNHSLPLVAVSIPNGLSAPAQTINLTNVGLAAGVRPPTQQPIRIHPSAVNVKTLVRGDQSQLAGGDARALTAATINGATAAVTPVTGATLGQPLDAAATNIVLNSGATSYLIADGAGLKSIKTDGGSIRLELHGNTFAAATAADTRFLHATPLAKVVTSGGGGAGIAATASQNLGAAQHIQIQPTQQQPTQIVQQQPIAPQLHQQAGPQHQVTYVAPTAGGTGQTLTLQQVHQVLSRLQTKAAGLKLYAPQGGTAVAASAAVRTATGPATATGHHRTTYVLQQDNQPS